LGSLTSGSLTSGQISNLNNPVTVDAKIGDSASRPGSIDDQPATDQQFFRSGRLGHYRQNHQTQN
jgi:hypothetical protein